MITSFLKMAAIGVFLALAFCAGWSVGQEEPQCPKSTVYNPVNTVTVNSCNQEADDELREELKEIKDLLSTMQDSLKKGDYCSDKEPLPPPPRDCYEVQQNGASTSGVYTVGPDGTEPFDVYCDMETDGGGWTVFQLRKDNSVDFYLDWASYKDGFGALEGEHWLGNDKLFYLTNQKPNLIRVDLEDFDGATSYAVYDSFSIANSSDNYRLSLGAYSGEAGDAMTNGNGQQFSTKDQDHDTWGSNCAETYRGAWWYAACHYANLNGQYLEGAHSSFADGVNWEQWTGYNYSLKRTEMKIRPVPTQ